MSNSPDKITNYMTSDLHSITYKGFNLCKSQNKGYTEYLYVQQFNKICNIKHDSFNN